MAWFNRISPDGLHVVGQDAPSNRIRLDTVDVGPGVSPVWWTPTIAIWSVPDTTLLAWQDVKTGRTGTINVNYPTNNLQGWGNNLVLASHRGNPIGWTTLRPNEVPVYTPGDVPYLTPSNTITTTINPSLWQPRVAGEFVLWMQPFVSPKGDTRLVVSRVNDFTKGWVVAVGNTFDPDMKALPNPANLFIVYTADGGITKSTVLNTNEMMVSLVEVQPPPPPPPPPEKPVNDEFKSFDKNTVTVLKGAEDVFEWPIREQSTASSTDEDVTVEFDDSRWPVIQYSDDSGLPIDINGTFWVVAKVNSKWYAAAFDSRRPGQTTKGCPRDEFGKDQIRRAPLDRAWSPKDGEVVGFFVSRCAMPYTDSNGKERTAVTWVKYNTSTVVGQERWDNEPHPEPEPEPEPQPDVDLKPVLDELKSLRAETNALRGQVAAIGSAIVNLKLGCDEGTKQDIVDIWNKVELIKAVVTSIPELSPATYVGTARVLGQTVKFRLTPEEK